MSSSAEASRVEGSATVARRETRGRRGPLFRAVLTLERRERLIFLAMLLPALLVTVVLVAWPILKLVQISFYELKLGELMRPITKPATLANYIRVLGHPDLPRVLWATFVFVVGSTAGAFLLGLATALSLERFVRIRGLLRAIVVSPWAIAPVIASIAWMYLLDERVGLVNATLLGTGLATEPVSFLASPGWALASVTAVALWKEYPFFTVVLLAAISSVPRECYEASSLDGASRWRQFRHITWPLIVPVAAVAGFLALLSAFRNVETILVLTGGGPARATETLAVRVYTETFRFLSPGTGAALGVLTLAIALGILLLFWPILRARPR